MFNISRISRKDWGGLQTLKRMRIMNESLMF